MAASSGKEGSSRPAVLGYVLSTVPPDPHGHRNGSRSRCIFSFVNLISWIIVAKQPYYGQSELYYYYSLCINVVRIIWRPANSRECHFGYHCRWQARDCCNLQRGSRNELISHLFYNFRMNPSMAALSNSFQRGSWGWGVFIYGNHAARRENGTSWWGCLCDVCFASNLLAKSLPVVSFLFPPECT